MSDEQDAAESVDEDMVGGDPVTSDEVGAFGDSPDDPVGLPFADADVTDESFARTYGPRAPRSRGRPRPAIASGRAGVLVDSDLLEQVDEDGDLAEPD